MSKRKYVEAGLHSELSEYASLLRALRTSSTLDLSSNLTLSNAKGTHPTPTIGEDLYEDDGDDPSAILDPDDSLDRQHGSVSDTDLRALSSQALTAVDEDQAQDYGGHPAKNAQSSSSRHDLKTTANRPATVRDTWTKWPLVPSEVYVPAWPMEEEVRLMAVEGLRRANGVGFSAEELEQESTAADTFDPANPDITTDAAVSRATLRALTRVTTKRLYEILATSSAMLPEGEDSLQNRHGYINWELVLSAMDAFGLYTHEQLDSIKQRMLILYPKYTARSTRNPYFVDPKAAPPKESMSFLTSEFESDLNAGDLKQLWLEARQHLHRHIEVPERSSIDRKGKGVANLSKKISRKRRRDETSGS